MKKPAGKTAAPAAAAKKAARAKTSAEAISKGAAPRAPRARSTAAQVDGPPAAVAAPAEPVADAPSGTQRGAKHLLTAGIKALTTAHEEAVARQSRVFESLLGVRRDDAPEAERRPAAVTGPSLDPFGFRKFEDVFDQRVASALDHLAVPSSEAFAELKAEVERLRETVAALEAQVRRR